MPKNFSRLLLGSSLVFLVVSLACNAARRVQEGVGEARQTAQAPGTDIGQGRDLLSTAQAVGTAVSGSDLLGTLQAAATQVDESGAVLTAQAFATQEGSQLLATAQAFATQQGPGLEQTAQALATGGPGLIETIQAAATQIPLPAGEPPPDIPMMQGERTDLITTAGLITYSTPAAFAEVVSFYKTQMPAQGWALDSSETLELDDEVILSYNKVDRSATVNITPSLFGSGTVVVITIS
jgi:hypothetical protein